MDRSKYDMWIASYIAAGNPIIGQCLPVCEKMQDHFPELVLHGGYAWTQWGCDLHYWLTAPDGSIVDPTESQFGSLVSTDYEDAGTTNVLELLKRFLIKKESA